jgi:hypothetical protein
MDPKFYVLRDVATGKFLKGRRLELGSLTDLNARVAIYHSVKNAEDGAREAIKGYLRRQPHWKDHPEYDGYRRDLRGVEVIELETALGAVCKTVQT